MNPDEETERLPVDPRGTALPPRPQPGYYPKFSTLGQQAFWDEATRAVVLRRVTVMPPPRFFTPPEAEVMQRVVEHVLPQDDRVQERRIPILPFIDERLFEGRTAGYRFEDMPHDGEAYRRFVRAVDLMALAAHGKQFLQLGWHEADVLLKSLHDAKPTPGAEEIWQTMPVKRFWALLVQDCAEVYYAHPWAWTRSASAVRLTLARISGWNAATPSLGKRTNAVTTGECRRRRFPICIRTRPRTPTNPRTGKPARTRVL